MYVFFLCSIMPSSQWKVSPKIASVFLFLWSMQCQFVADL